MTRKIAGANTPRSGVLCIDYDADAIETHQFSESKDQPNVLFSRPED